MPCATRRGSTVPEDALYQVGSPATQTMRLELGDLQRALDRLPASQRAVVLLIGLENLNYEEVGEVLGIPVGTVRSRLFRARESLRALLDEPTRLPSRSQSRREARDASAPPSLAA